jgi:ATP/maltotriose-dependent transcriptional regulator MalT
MLSEGHMVENRVGPPVRGKDFYGRERFVNLVATKLKAGHVLLAAPRRFGKTSVMYNLIDQPPRRRLSDRAHRYPRRIPHDD